MRLVVLYSILAVILLLLLLQPSSAETIEVCEKCDFSTIQDAINASKEGDTILVASGMYRENLKISKSIKIVGSDGTILEPRFIVFPTIQVALVQNFVIENVQIKNGSVGLDALLLNGFEIENCIFQNNFDAISISQSSQGKLGGLSVRGFSVGLKVEGSRLVKVEDGLFEDGVTGLNIEASNGIALSNLSINGVQRGIEFSGGEGNLVENSVFSGDGSDVSDVFISAFSENGLIVSGNDVKGILAVDEASHGNRYAFEGLNVSGREFQISLEEVELSERFVKLSDAVNATITPDIYSGAGYVYVELSLGGEEIDRLSNQINVSSIAFYRLNGSSMERVSDYYNSSDFLPLNFVSNESGIYFLGAEIIQPEKTPTPSAPAKTPTPVSTPAERKWIPGFEFLSVIVGISVALILRERRGAK